MGHYYHHEDLLGDLVSSESFAEGSDSSFEDVWDLFMDFPEGEPIKETREMLPKVEQEEDGLNIKVSDTFERFRPRIYIGTMNNQII